MALNNDDRRMGDKVSIGGNYQYNAYFHGTAAQRYWHRFKIDAAIDALNIKNGQQILDAGCGSGILTAFVAKQNETVNIIGVDGNEGAIRFCTEQWKDIKNVHFVKTQIDELLQFGDASINSIAFLEVIEHITEKQANDVLLQFFRILKDEGTLVVSTPNRKSLWPLQEWLLDRLRLIPRLKGDQHEKLYSGKELEKIAAANGLTTVQKHRINFIAPWIAIFSEKLAIKVFDWEMKKNWVPGSLLLYKFRK